MASAAGGSPSWRPDQRALFATRPRHVVRGVNLLAELEALTVLGAGRFEVGVNFVLNVFEAVPLAEHSGVAAPTPFAGREDRRHWRARIYERDAYRLARMGSSVALALSHVVGVAWPHVPSGYRERFARRLEELPDDAMARSWKAAGGAPWWEPPRASGEQMHFLLDEPGAFHDVGVPR